MVSSKESILCGSVKSALYPLTPFPKDPFAVVVSFMADIGNCYFCRDRAHFGNEVKLPSAFY